MFRAVLVMMMIGSLCAHARIGETLEELQARFGAGVVSTPTSNPPPGVEYHVFNKDGVQITAVLINGKCERITYHQGILGQTVTRKLTKEEIKNLLDANNGGQRWLADDDINFSGKSELSFRRDPTAWKRSDRKAHAKLSSRGDSITFTSTGYDKLMEKAKKGELEKKVKRPLKGF